MTALGYWTPPSPTGGFLGSGLRKPASAPPAPAPAPRRPVDRPARQERPALPPARDTRPMDPAPGTVRAVILRAVADLAGGRVGVSVPVADVVVRAWRLDPARFGLPGHAHPDSNRVLAKVYGRTGLVGLGLLAQPEQRVVALTRKGAAQASECAP